jgi:hypothetical protein
MWGTYGRADEQLMDLTHAGIPKYMGKTMSVFIPTLYLSFGIDSSFFSAPDFTDSGFSTIGEPAKFEVV